MRTPSWSDRINRSLGFHEDERVRQVHGNAVRTAYIALAVATVPFGVFQQYALQQREALWATLAVLALSLLALLVRRVQLNGFGAADERMIRARQSVFAWPCFVLVFGMWALTMHQALVLGNGLALVVFPLYALIGVAAVLLTRAWNGTMQGNAWYWLLNALFMFGLVGWNVWQSEPGTRNAVGRAALAFMLIWGMVCVLLAWRRWQEQRSADHG